jgi:YjbE family integral membrane protein
MEFQSYVSWISSPVQIAFLDLVLGADNAFIIALVCRTLPLHMRMRVMIVGTATAVLLRLVLTALTGALMFVPLLRLVGGIVLVLIALSLTDELDLGETDQPEGAAAGPDRRNAQAEAELFWDAILVVTLADGVMSLDNSVALAAVAKGDVIYLALGLLLSVPTLVFGSWLLSQLLGQTPLLAKFAMAVLAWVAGDMIVSDPLIAGWIATDAPALGVGVPVAAVVFVLAKTAFRPIAAVPLLDGPLTGGASEADASRNAPTIDAEPEPVPEPFAFAISAANHPPAEPVSAPEPEIDVDPELAALATPEPDDSEPPRRRTLEDRLVVAGLVALFGVAAIIMSAAIYFGNATF